MELYFGEYQHVQQEYGVHLRLASDETRKSRNPQHAKAGSYGVSIRVQGIDGHPYIVLNNTEQCLAGTSFSENGPSFPAPMINNLPLHPSKGSVVEENSAEELQLPENPYAPPGPVRNLKQTSLFEGKNGALERKEEPRKASPVLNFQRHPELLQPYDPEKNELSLKNHQPPGTSWLKALREEGTNNKKAWTCMPKPSHSQPTSPPSEDPTRSNVTAIRLCSSVVIDDPQKQTSVCVNVQSCSKEALAEEALAPSGRPLPTPSLQAHPEAKKTRPDVLPFRRQDSAGPVLDGARSRRSSSSSTTPTSANSLYRFLLDDQECAIHADNVNRHENRRYIPFLPGTGRDIDTGSIPGVDQLIEKFDQKPGMQRRGRSGKRNRINPEDRKRSRSVDSAFPFGLQGNSEYLTEFSRNLGKSSEHLLRPSQVCPQRAQEPRGGQGGGRAFSRLLGAQPRPSLQNKDGKVPENKGAQESPTGRTSSLPAQTKKEEEIKTATATLMLQNRALATSPDSGTKRISVKTFTSTSNTQATPDLLKGQQELTQQTNEETAKQILYNYLKEGSTDNDDATKRKVNLVFEKIQTLKSRAAGSTQGNNQASNSSSEVKDLLEQKNKLTTEVAELQTQLQLEVKNQQNIKEERDRMKADLEVLQSQHDSKVEESSALQRRLEESEGALRRHLEELFQVKMEREQHQTEIRDLQDQLSEMHDELDSAKQSEDREKGALIEELLQAKQDLQHLLIAKEEQEDLLRKRERELTALKGALKEEVSSHDREMDKLKEQYDAELLALRESVEEATKVFGVGLELADYEKGEMKGKITHRMQETLLEASRSFATKKDHTDQIQAICRLTVGWDPHAEMDRQSWRLRTLGNQVQHKEHLVRWECAMCVWAGALHKKRVLRVRDPDPKHEPSPGEGKGYPLQYSGLENSLDCIVYGSTDSRVCGLQWLWCMGLVALQREKFSQTAGSERPGSRVVGQDDEESTREGDTTWGLLKKKLKREMNQNPPSTEVKQEDSRLKKFSFSFFFFPLSSFPLP
ncbi:hypothetical protein FD754_018688 [Muntiacus muntjak]|uniref:Myosin tail domain-containing protein n=1 Tax=Muntiacus muntjak TaxID=9888 RepID=A0A5N3UY38_MUNMU|nr:hypothetical protein FD754_018688 [Muntiacus muntjak]